MKAPESGAWLQMQQVFIIQVWAFWCNLRFHPSLVFAHIVQSEFQSNTDEVSGHQNNQNTSSVQLFVTYDEYEMDQCATVCKPCTARSTWSVCNCVQLCKGSVCNWLAAELLTSFPLSLFPTFPPPPSHKNARSALTPQLLLLNFCDCDPPWRPPIGHWLRMAGCSGNVVQSPLSSPSLAFPGTVQSNRQQLLYVLLCYFFSFFVWAFLSPFSCVFLIFLYKFLHGSSWPVFTTFLHLAPAQIT